MRASLRFLALLSLALAGCSGAQRGAALRVFYEDLIGPHLSLAFSPEIAFPDEVTLETPESQDKAARLGGALFEAVAGESLPKKVGRLVKGAGQPLRRATASAFRKALEDSKLFGSVTEKEGGASMALGVGRWGFAYDEASGAVKPVLDLEASLSLPVLGVVWRGRRSAAQLSAAVRDQAFELTLQAIAAKPKSLDAVLGLVAGDLSRQLVDELRSNPPRRRRTEPGE